MKQDSPKLSTPAQPGPGPHDDAGNKLPRRRQELIDVAARVFAVRGYEAASIQDIADELGILKGSVYYYIDTKQELLFAVLQDMHESASGNVERVSRLSSDPLTLIRLFVESQFMFLCANLVEVTVFFQDFGSLDENGRELIVAERDNYDKFVRELIVLGQLEGSVCRRVNPKLATLAILGMVNWSYQWFRVGGTMDPATVARQFADFAVAGLVCNDSHEVGSVPPNIVLGFGGMPEIVVTDEPRLAGDA
jgi:TetR/AcrR family transcriptional regulator, cholesterol catabolism regulator